MLFFALVVYGTLQNVWKNSASYSLNFDVFNNKITINMVV